MPRYFFHLRDHGLIRDEEGAELPGIDAARVEARMIARALLAEGIRQVDLQELRAVEIWTDDECVAVVHFGNIFQEGPSDAASLIDPDVGSKRNSGGPDHDDYD